MVNLTKYERARIIGARALQIAMGAPQLLKMRVKDLEAINYSPVELAKMELEKGIMPITIRRPLPKKTLPKKEQKEAEEEAS